MIYTSRVAIEGVRPTVRPPGFAAKGITGQAIPVRADVFADGHDQLMARVAAWPAHDPARRRESPMVEGINDRWEGEFTSDAVGAWEFEIAGMVDHYGTWLRDTAIKLQAGQDVRLELEEGATLVERRAGLTGLADKDASALRKLASALRDPGAAARCVRTAGAVSAVTLMRRTAPWDTASTAGPFPVWVDRERAGFSAWYEMFPRSEGATATKGGNFKAAAARLPAIAEMGFDIVYLPPIHPIGESFRKGPNNALTAGPDDPGSPWAIGGEAGGHKAVDPGLGTLADFDAFVAAAHREGLEVALDYALQCSPDHPWVSEHPEWFSQRPDGSIKYAENPPKKYQDIYPINFESETRAELWAALRDVMDFWIAHGVRVFRVDNPHTKALPFWQWLIQGVHEEYPDVIFLAEAFTRPRMMERLAKIGFSQSYTYFTWRNRAWELREYLTELSQGDAVDYFRPNFWVNTPDILHEFLQRGGQPAFRIRAALAALGCPSWGMYSGFELYENIPVREGSEEYMDSEKYQFRPRRWDGPESLAPYIARLNEIRRRHRGAISSLRTLRVQQVDSEDILCFSRRDPRTGDILLVAVNTDPFNVHEASTWLDLDELGIGHDESYVVQDELGGATYAWHGAANYLRLDPRDVVAHAFAVKRGDAG
ncbi:MAG: alpha-1,4-glucan--maltose-1-phosphate maltosyltransferase [Candidatus Dormibacteria bacterium]